MSRHKFVYMVLVDEKFRNALFSCSATYLTKFFTDLFNFSRVPDKLRPNKNDESLSCLDPSSVDQDIPKVNSHHPTFYGAPTVPCIHVFCFISPTSTVRGHHVLKNPMGFFATIFLIAKKPKKTHGVFCNDGVLVQA